MKSVTPLNLYIETSGHPTWKASGRQNLMLQSQVWRQVPWHHHLTLTGATRGATQAILIVTGGPPNALDEAEAAMLASLSGLPVITLYDIPNQPLFDDLWEDDLIAWTFVNFLETGETDWPLLFPMVKSVVSAMDAAQEVWGFDRFIITGVSKRGWTTWLAGTTADPRIIGIAPMSIDHLDIPRQMAHQQSTWGQYSDQFRSYTELELPKQLDSLEGQALNAMIDPFVHIDRIDCPILIVNGTNDPYWQVDALSLYWDRLPQETWCSILPNLGHNLDHDEKNKVLAAFARCITREQPVCNPIFRWNVQDARVVLEANVPATRIWQATSENYDFRERTWTVFAERPQTLQIEVPTRGYTALLGQWSFREPEFEYSLTTPILVVDQTGPLRPN